MGQCYLPGLNSCHQERTPTLRGDVIKVQDVNKSQEKVDLEI